MKGGDFNLGGIRSRLPILAGIGRVFIVASLLLIVRIFTGCGVGDQTSAPARDTNASIKAASTALKSDGIAEILLFNGTGSSPNDVKAFETILKDQHLNYLKVDSSQLNGMSGSQMRGYRLLIVPGARNDFYNAVSADTAYAWTLIHAALNRESLPHY